MRDLCTLHYITYMRFRKSGRTKDDRSHVSLPTEAPSFRRSITRSRLSKYVIGMDICSLNVIDQIDDEYMSLLTCRAHDGFEVSLESGDRQQSGCTLNIDLLHSLSFFTSTPRSFSHGLLLFTTSPCALRVRIFSHLHAYFLGILYPANTLA